MREKRNKFEAIKRDELVQFRIFVLLFNRFKLNAFKLIGQDKQPIELDANGVFLDLFALSNVDVSSADGCWRSRLEQLVNGRPIRWLSDRWCV